MKLLLTLAICLVTAEAAASLVLDADLVAGCDRDSPDLGHLTTTRSSR